MRAAVVAPVRALLTSYRGSVLDLLVVAVNLFVDPRATAWIVDVVNRAPDERSRGAIVGIGAALMFLLPPAAAVLKRRRTHARLAAQAAAKGVQHAALEPGCLFNPIVYLSVNLVLGSAIMAGLAPLVFGGDAMDRGSVFVSLTLLVMVASVVQTAVVYQYFRPPRSTPGGTRTRGSRAMERFLASSTAEFLGDACIFVTTLLFQTVWLTLASTPFERVTGAGDVLGRLFFVLFAALLVYFPPRMLYLVEELRRPTAQVTLVLANAAMLYRLFMGGP